MGTLQRYILKSYLLAFLLTGLVLTFVLSIGFLFRVMQFLSRGASFSLVAQYLLASMPEVLGFTIPLALLVSALLVFGRMSTDSEIAAMKACGVSFFTIMRGPLIIAVLCSALGFYLQNYAMPRGHYVRRLIANRLAMDAGVQLIEPGRFIDEIDNLTIFCDRKSDCKDANGKGYTALSNLLAIDRRDGFLREIRAETAELRAEGCDMVFTLHQAKISPPEKGIRGTVTMDLFSYVCKDVVSRSKTYNKKPKDFDFGELLGAERAALSADLSDKAVRKWRSKLLFLLNYRMVWALSAFCFVLVGIPLGCQSQRKESSRGMILGIAVGLAFFLFIMLSESLCDKPATAPWILVWTPVAICVATAIILIPKNQ
ncbi:MAG: LptF/LptG family permease [Kiritimatiellia bacterium]